MNYIELTKEHFPGPGVDDGLVLTQFGCQYHISREGALFLKRRLMDMYPDPTPAINPDLVKQDFADIISRALATHKERGAVYKDGYLIHAKILMALFPEKFPDLESTVKFFFFNNCITKIVRYGVALESDSAGHRDSVHDLGVYAFLLETLHDRSEK